ncbi:plexin-A2-like [Paramacrobiotus metropolitanus]|uniref:plexin-A2-like n=1 Tax=Paramacrobiotus metropolitanus TaxID=2943436 RepID=UPI00244610E9|nr:plexin-A2-like [Paramacrobiotus metropolitanus]XP_055342713.1 plexin-A2-like [Paramacrobiotus metropolitanus]XP_055342714.1 plexin-A2-like [Paramacrobiotus metropolitanus]
MLRPYHLDDLMQMSVSSVGRPPPRLRIKSGLTHTLPPTFFLWNLLFIICILCPICHCSGSIVSTFTIDDAGSTGKFAHLHVHRSTGKVYVGAVNRLFQLDPDLALEESVVTGPVNESPSCPVNGDCSSYPRILNQNENRVLLPYYDRERLIVCGTANHGKCVMRDMKNITGLLESDNVEEAVVPMDPQLSVVAFVAPGPPSAIAGGTSKVLYLGRSVYAGSEDNVFAVSSRSLDPRNLFQLVFNDPMKSTGTYVMIDSKTRQNYRINYVHGFASGRFSYFITTQPRSTDLYEPVRTKLIRICQDDENYYSYTEVPLVCANSDRTYDLAQAASLGSPGTELAANLGIKVTDDILVVAFADQAGEPNQNRPDSHSAVCMYSLAQIQQQFTDNIRQCFIGNGMAGLSFIRQTKQCLKSLIEVGDNFCGSDFNYPLNGSIPITATPILTYSDVRITAVATSVTHAYTVLFLGTEKGVLKKVLIDSKQTAREYEEIPLSSAPILPDMHISPTKEFIYAATASQISKIRVQDCSVYTSCGDCLGHYDPYCGWCSLENKCSLRSQCSANAAKNDNTYLYWLPFKSQKCTRIVSVTPSQIQRTTSRTLALAIENLPSADGPLVCVFSAQGRSLETNATRSQDGVSCLTPRVDLLPEIPDGENAVSVRVAIRLQGAGTEFGADNVTFYDCASLDDCTSCVSSPYPCDWCVQNHRCTHNAGENCRSDYLVNGQNRSGYSSRSGPDFCPRIGPAEGFVKDQYMLVPSDMLRKIMVKVENIQPFQTRFTCVFNIDGRVERTEANYVGDTVSCSPLQFAYMATAPNATAQLDITWADRKPLDNPKNLHVLMYKCAIMSSNCGFCLDLPSEFECGWCEKSCQVTNQCPGVWLNKNSTCPNPEIQQFYPSLGPWEGGTLVTIEGINLGKTFGDIASGVQVAGRRCSPIPDRYERTSKIVCQTDAVEQLQGDQILSGDVEVAIARQFTALSDSKFSYVDPKLASFSPKLGPKSGGTQLTIQGRYLNAGSRVVVTVGKNVCDVQRRNATTLTCVTSGAASISGGLIEVMLDRGRRQLEEQLFEYVTDPEVTRVNSFGSGQLNLGPRGTASGGSYIFVEGSNLNVIAQPRIVVHYNGRDYEGMCTASSDIRMECRSPAIPDLGSRSRRQRSVERPLELDYSFYLDGVQSVRNISKLGQQFPKFKLYPSPVVANFSDPNGIKYHKSEYLFIDGENLDQSYRLEDYRVEIGMELCNVTSLTQRQLTCRPPDTEPAARGLDGQARIGALPEVRVIITDRQNFTIGTLSYEPLAGASLFTTEVIIGISVGCGVLILIVIIFIILYRKKTNESSRVLKTMQDQIDALELQVASECKEAFAELQTDITDWTGDLSTGGIPFRDYRWYVAKVLFPNSDTHPLMTGEMVVDPARKQNIDSGLKLFGELLHNKTFLLTFIRTLESNRYFGMRDRVNVASLLMAVLQSNMVYCTDILKTLLSDLIEKCVDGKSNPNLKLLMRRNESVAEKMLSAWLTFLLYGFLRDVAGRPLYLLYRAVQMQIEKGPVDSITSEAKYSLSEEKLIRQKIDHKKMHIYVSCVDSEHSSQDYQVKVLDCDSITQVKEKALDVIYRNTPFSRRPRPEALDLEWRTGQAGRCPLQDEDTTSQTETGSAGTMWKRLNTLQHYHVNDGAAFVLVPKHTNFYNLTIMSDKSDKSLQSHKSSPALSRGVSPFVHTDAEHGVKVWHLVRPHDTPDPPSRDGTTKRGSKMMTEIYLTRLLTTKTTLKKFIDEMFECILSTNTRGYAFPAAIKHLFDFLDDQALHHEISDPEVVHTWKSNSVPLRFWVNLLKNPNFIFDIHKSNSVDSCLSVIAQALMESCSTSDLKLSKDSPSSKLLFAKDIANYQELVRNYYDDIKYQVPEITEQEFNQLLAEESKLHRHEFHTRPALLELFTYAKKHIDPLMAALSSDEFSERAKIPTRLLQILQLMNADGLNRK